MDILNDNQIISKLKNTTKKYNMKILILFGSRAQKKYNKKSDFDFAFIPSTNFTTKDEINLFNDIMHILKTENIDLINISNNHDVKLRHEIFSNGVCIYEYKKGIFLDMKVKAWIDYIDFKKFTKNRLDMLKKDIENLEV